jgi:hypothetical protein
MVVLEQLDWEREGEAWSRRRLMGDLLEDLLNSEAGVLILGAWFSSSKLAWLIFYIGLTVIIYDFNYTSAAVYDI